MKAANISPPPQNNVNFFYLTKNYDFIEGSLRERKKMPENGKNPKGGGEGSTQKIKKPTIKNEDFLIFFSFVISAFSQM